VAIDIDIATGFLPVKPIPRLQRDFTAWEDLLDAFQSVALHSEEDEPWRNQVRTCPVLSADALRTTQELRRAHLVLAFLTHRYLHSLPSGEAIVPRSVAVPFLAVSERLDLPPVLTYADTVLWNWSFGSPKQGFIPELVGHVRHSNLLTNAGRNLRIAQTFTGTPSEDHFFLSSLLIELQGVTSLRLMALALDEAFVNDALAQQRIATYLYEIAHNIEDMTQLMRGIKTDVDASVFYNNIRPWFNGGPRRFELEDGSYKDVDLGGPSAGQSTLIHALDVFFSIDHAPRNGTEAHDDTFMARMATYMPHHHRLFLRHLGTQEPSIRTLALASPVGSHFREAYDLCIDAIKRLREAHTSLVYSHIIVPAQKAAKAGEPMGTGGTNVVSFLKLTRERTIEARLASKESAQ
jgi:indoleamine 2,3-dioxygenase